MCMCTLFCFSYIESFLQYITCIVCTQARQFYGKIGEKSLNKNSLTICACTQQFTLTVFRAQSCFISFYILLCIWYAIMVLSVEDEQYAAIFCYLQHRANSTQPYSQNPRNLYHKEAAKFPSRQKASCITRNRLKMEQTVINL